ncbi:MAG: hypothetical protein IT292_07680 [Deltaproteobacteria bacterium]|nr:hypothetical protein [Deltaproteobacteria bacterium]
MTTSTIDRPAFLEFIDHVMPEATKTKSKSTNSTTSNSNSSGASGSSGSSSSKSTQAKTKNNYDSLVDQINKNINITSSERDMWSFIGDVISGKVGGSVNEQTKQMLLQNALQKLQSMYSFISNMLKTLHDTAMNSINNIK